MLFASVAGNFGVVVSSATCARDSEGGKSAKRSRRTLVVSAAAILWAKRDPAGGDPFQQSRKVRIDDLRLGF